MAQLVLISAGTYRENLNEIGDIVSIHDDDVLLSGPGYDSFEVLQITGLQAEEIRAELALLEESTDV